MAKKQQKKDSVSWKAFAGIVVFVIAAGRSAHAPGHAAPAHTTAAAAVPMAPAGAVAKAIAYARVQIGKPYLWGGTGPYAFDCSGLVMMAYRAAGIDIPRTSEDQWAWGPQIPAGSEEPGDLVFMAGSDGTMTSPGHVGIVIGHGLMIQALGSGTTIMISSYLTRTDLVGFTRPVDHAGVAG